MTKTCGRWRGTTEGLIKGHIVPLEKLADGRIDGIEFDRFLLIRHVAAKSLRASVRAQDEWHAGPHDPIPVGRTPSTL